MNLNSLLALDTLLRRGGVTAAAREMGITQSAMSHQLAVLRETFQDPILVRSAGGMTLTPRARRLAEPLGASLGALAQLMRSHQAFDPATSEHTFRISVGQHLGVLLLSDLLDALSVAAPHVRIEAREVPRERCSEALESGETDLVIGLPEQLHAGIITRPWLVDSFACALRTGHPALAETFDVDAYAKLRHLVVSPTGRGSSPIDDALRERGLVRNVVLRVDSFLSGPMVVAESDLVITAPRASLMPWVRRGELVLRPVPLPDMKSKTISAMWHEGRAEEPAHRWFRELLFGIGPPNVGEESESDA